MEKVDPYFSTSECVSRLMNTYKLHNSLVIGFDFDDTIYDYHKRGYEYNAIIEILKQCNDLGFILVLFTANEGLPLLGCMRRCKELGIKVSHVNESPLNPGQRKPHFNLLLDDRAGLGQAYTILSMVVNNVKELKK